MSNPAVLPITSRDYGVPHRGLALAVILRGVMDHHYAWLLGSSATLRFWTDVGEVDRAALGERAVVLREEWLWDLATRRIRAALECTA